jgi:hypothetical protein
MKRLIELSADDPLTTRAQSLVRALGPTVDSEARMRRVRQALDAPLPRQKRRWVAPSAFAVALLGATAAAASWGSQWLGAPEPVSAVVPPAAPQTRAPARVEPQPARPPMGGPSVATPHPSSVAASPPAARAPSAGSDVARVHEAAKALRRHGDPERALVLLERSPIQGPLAEEALALRIEASLMAGNGRQVKLAASYLKRYPAGRYRELAQRALGDSKE